jgi:flagellum-specific ATP synthase
MIESLVQRIETIPRFQIMGSTTRVVGLVVEATGMDVALGELCRVRATRGEHTTLAEVVGFHERGILLMPLGSLEGVHPGSVVQPLGRTLGADVGPGLLGRVLDGLGHPIDGKGKVPGLRRVPMQANPPNPLEREPIGERLTTGVRAIDGLLTIGRGQRVGIFSGSGVGKSTLLGMIARNTSADVNVIALLGERGREVRDFIDNSLGPEGLARSVVIVATGEEAALIRARGAQLATAIAEYYRDEGKHVLLMVDSITRVAMAWREIGLAVGEPPTTKGYPPSVFASLPRLLERAGNGARGAISAMYTVLVEGDDFNEPIADAARSILDGHIILSRRLATAAHFPAIEVLDSNSRVREQVADLEQQHAADSIARLLAAYREKEELIAVGAYQAGADSAVDAAIRMRPAIEDFLRQPPDDRATFEVTRSALLELAVRSQAANQA